MSSKQFTIIFVVVLIIAAVALGISKTSEKPPSIPGEQPSPSPSAQANIDPNSLQLSQGQSSQSIGAQTQPQQQRQQQAQNMPQIKQYSTPFAQLPEAELKNKKAVIETDKGTIEFEIYTDSPKAATNYISLANDGFFDGLVFHRVVPGFVIQGGDPLGNGSGGPGYKFEDEPVTKKYVKGIVAMANAGPDTNGSQFFIMLEDNLDLPPNYTIFGKVIKGIDVVEKIKVGDRMNKVSIQPLK